MIHHAFTIPSSLERSNGREGLVLLSADSSREYGALVLLHYASALRKVRWTGAAFRAEAVNVLWLVRRFCLPRRGYGAALRPEGPVADCLELVPNEFVAHLEAGEVERLELQDPGARRPMKYMLDTSILICFLKHRPATVAQRA